MKPINMADSIASEMERILGSEEHKQMFAPKLEKLAFSRVSDADKPTDIAQELEVALDKTAQISAAPAPTPPGQTAPAQQPATQQPNREQCKACKGFYVRDDGDTKCTCEEQGLKFADCKMNPQCHCHKHPATPVVNPVAWRADDGKESSSSTESSKSTVASMVAQLSKISATLDNAGFDKLAAVSLMLADRIVVEAKAKAKSKSKKSEKKDSKKPSKKMTTKERMEKMRAGKAKAKKSEPKSKKSK